MMPVLPPDSAIEDALVPVSALQHYLFCPRQCALIHVERIWTEDGATAQGRLLHERVDGGKADRRQGVRTVRGLILRSLALGVWGKADAVEFHGSGAAACPYPIEYKHGQPKLHRADEVQLCAQALCLEEMFGRPVPEGALFYARTRKRSVIAIDAELRALTIRVVVDVRAMMAQGSTPAPRHMAACRACSMIDDCRPKRLEKPPSVARWLVTQLAD